MPRYRPGKNKTTAPQVTEERFAFPLFEVYPDAIALIDAQSRVQQVNRAFERIFGCSRQEIKGTSIEWLVPEQKRMESRQTMQQTLGNQPVVLETIRQHKDGTSIDVLLRGLPLVSESGERIVAAIYTDITDQKRMERELVHARKIESVGRLAGAIAHDFNNLLAIISGNAEVLLMAGDLPEESRERRRVEAVLEASRRATVLVDKLMSFGQRQLLRPRRIDLNLVLNESEKLLRRALRADIELVMRPASTPLWVMLDPLHIDRCLLDLALYAQEAMPEGGQITLTAEEKHPEESTSEPGDFSPARCAVLTVTDTGRCLSIDERERLFEPAFASIEVGKGSGLLIPGVYGFVRQSGGRMTIEHQTGPGVTFGLYFPLMEQEADEATAAASTPSALWQTEVTGTVLVVEDEPEVRALVADVLRRSGFTVLEAEHGAQALETAAGQSLDLLVTDMVMPVMGGAALALALKKTNPDLPTIYISGYPGEQIRPREGVGAEAAFLQKPFSAEVLLEKVQAVLAL